ncbi:uncharacterized protein [Macrobrachium rosenbergii]|uniref:uncharacterized protein n=1 Tax=Macrobrachium rosenbergii TaxID=79674 RepID=UPI0034D587B5
MVAPHDTGDLVRSLVRVPGSGSNRAAGSECLDLGRASSLAASVPVPTTLPPALATPKVVRQTPPSVDKLGSQVGVEAGILPAKPEDRKRQRSEELPGSDSEASVPKRPRIFALTQASPVVSAQAGQFVVVSLQPQTSSPPSINFSGAASLSQLIKERDNLRKENQELQKRLSLFHQLFKDKRRLTSVVKRLGVNVP